MLHVGGSERLRSLDLLAPQTLADVVYLANVSDVLPTTGSSPLWPRACREMFARNP